MSMNDMCISSWSQSCHELLGWLAGSLADASQSGIEVLFGLYVTQSDAYQIWTEGVNGWTDIMRKKCTNEPFKITCAATDT